MGPKQGWTADISGIERRCSEPGSGRPGGSLEPGQFRGPASRSSARNCSRIRITRAQVDCAVLNVSLSERGPLNRRVPQIAGAFFAGDRAERRPAPAIDLLREDAERET